MRPLYFFGHIKIDSRLFTLPRHRFPSFEKPGLHSHTLFLHQLYPVVHCIESWQCWPSCASELHDEVLLFNHMTFIILQFRQTPSFSSKNSPFLHSKKCAPRFQFHQFNWGKTNLLSKNLSPSCSDHMVNRWILVDNRSVLFYITLAWCSSTREQQNHICLHIF